MLAADATRRLPSGWPVALWAAVLLLGVTLRLAALDKPLYIDEMTTVTVAAQPLDQMARVMRLIDASPAAFPLLLHAWMQVSAHDVWLRLLPALCGCLALWVTWRLASDVYGWQVGLAATFVMALAPTQVHYAQYIRSYSLFGLLAVSHVWLLLQVMDDPRRRRWVRVVPLSGLTAALLYTHYLSLLLFAAQGLWLLWQLPRRRPQVLIVGAAMTAGAVLFVPGVPLLKHNLAYDAIRNEDRPPAPPLVELVPTLVSELVVGQRALGFSDPSVRRATMAAGLVVIPLLVLLGARSQWTSRREATLLLLCVLVVPIAVYVGSGRRLVAVRFFVPFLSAGAVLAGAGLLAVRRRAARIALVAAVAVVSAIPLGHFLTRYAWSYDHAAVARAMAASTPPADAILVVHPFEAFYYRHYLGEAVPIEGLTFTPLVEQETYVIKPSPLDVERARQRIEAARARFARVWVVGGTQRSFATSAPAEAELFRWLDRTFTLEADLDGLTGGDPSIRLYALDPPGAPGAQR